MTTRCHSGTISWNGDRFNKKTIYEQTTKQNIQGTRMHSNKWDTAYSDL